MYIRLTWDPKKRNTNLAVHGIDFRDARTVFAGPTYTYEDDRFSYNEQRFVTLGLLKGVAVSIVHTESENEIRIVSFRRATPNEELIFFEALEDRLGPNAHKE